MLSKQAIEEYKILYKKQYGIILDDTEASFRANNLINLYKFVLESESSKLTKIVEKSRYDYR